MNAKYSIHKKYQNKHYFEQKHDTILTENSSLFYYTKDKSLPININLIKNFICKNNLQNKAYNYDKKYVIETKNNTAVLIICKKIFF